VFKIGGENYHLISTKAARKELRHQGGGDEVSGGKRLGDSRWEEKQRKTLRKRLGQLLSGNGVVIEAKGRKGRGTRGGGGPSVWPKWSETKGPPDGILSSRVLWDSEKQGKDDSTMGHGSLSESFVRKQVHVGGVPHRRGRGVIWRGQRKQPKQRGKKKEISKWVI